ncbi:unnamed protein product [Aspergillus oryzae RIB40]|uniref:DNA, SC103 n=2 Tax=Aspergillus oryzae TaxID=5062 RepID=Q2TXV5_ASPOR|nr:unnamed protein product [Aspergillus oryzae RIB40]EIT82729.1 hypothetical protein Ao3042_00095 [Aspergillus oryzae 3.042]KDE78993.1 hypothetical protein AO1008_05175 [Aspergillus oryzae 100-8]BAE65918.1 unnamed protein product [Aspergillus oryzae RIB40]|eukprot:EIT82729.1 hypothetical protein Ao3042_00095 [Aspergillus oryzae 3.042]
MQSQQLTQGGRGRWSYPNANRAFCLSAHGKGTRLVFWGQIPSNVLETEEKEFCDKIDPRAPFTSMVVAHDCRLIMGPGREGDVFGIVALVPDERMNEDPNATQSWVSEGKLDKLMETFSEFPRWITDIFKYPSRASTTSLSMMSDQC